MNTAQHAPTAPDKPRISKRILERTTRATLARFATRNTAQHSTITAAEAYANKLLDSRDPYQSVYVSDTELLVDLKKTRDPHYPFRAIIYNDKGEWARDIPLTAAAELAIIN